MHIQYWIMYNTYYVVVLWAICLSTLCKKWIELFPSWDQPKGKKTTFDPHLYAMLPNIWHPVMNSLSHWFEIFFNLWLTPSWCNKKTRWNGLLKSILAMLPKGEITFEKVDSSFQQWFSGLFEIQNQHVVSSLSFSHFLFMIKLSQLTT